MLNSRFFGQIDEMIKKYLTPLILGKQQSQMNESVCYDISLISQWQDIIQNDIDYEEITSGFKEQIQDTRQILFKSLIEHVAIIQV